MKLLRCCQYRIFALCLLLLGTGGGIYAQRPGGPPPPPGEGLRPGPPPGERGGIFNVISAEMRFGDRPLKGAPYSAEVVIESTQTLTDGTRITRQVKASVYRDSEGRVRREQTLGSIGPFPPPADAPKLVFITDPTKGTHSVLDVNRLTARQMPFAPHKPPPPPSDAPNKPTAVTESLGKKTIEGVEAEGIRATITIPAGQIGNDRPLHIVSERWYAPDLQLVVLSIYNDPRLGSHTFRLTNIKRDEPARALFEIPANYRVEKARGRRDGPPPPRPE